MLDYRMMLAKMPKGLEQAVLTALSARVGVQNAIGRQSLTSACVRQGVQASERQVRETIKTLRRKGVLICSMAGVDGGYYLPANKEEYEMFRKLEFAGKIKDMSETMRAMDEAAGRAWGGGQPAEQLRMGL